MLADMLIECLQEDAKHPPPSPPECVTVLFLRVSILSCVFRITAARRAPPLAAESRSPRPATAQKPNCDRLGHTPDETTHTVAKVVARKKPVMLRSTLRLSTHVLKHATRSL